MKAVFYCSVATLFGTAAAWGQVQGVPGTRTANEGGMEVLTRGPVHEAFAETVTFDPEPGIVAPKAPPDPIEEVAPDQRPEGTNVAWIPGYWAWDDERSDFLWVSGIWRALPPSRQWVPGYWGRAGQGAQWTSGYWADGNANEVEYLPEPPATVEAGPNVPAASADNIWLPGCWLWQQNRYAWRPGYWAKGYSEWNRQVQANFTHRRDHEEARPARTLAAQQQLLGSGRVEQNMDTVIAQQFEQLRKAKGRTQGIATEISVS